MKEYILELLSGVNTFIMGHRGWKTRISKIAHINRADINLTLKGEKSANYLIRILLALGSLATAEEMRSLFCNFLDKLMVLSEKYADEFYRK